MDTDWPLIAVRFALYSTLSGLFGLSAFGLYALEPGARAEALALRLWLAAGGVLGLVFSGVALALLAAAMTGAPPWPINHAAVGMLLSGTATGAAWEARMVALAIATIAALAAAGRAAPLGLAALAAGVALATLAWTGHGAMDDGAVGWIHLGADILHLLAGGAWAGALLGLLLLVARPLGRADRAHVARTHRALRGFGLVGTLLVATLALTGLVNAGLLVGLTGLPSLAGTLYGRLLIAKLALFAAMLALASLNRFRLTPALERLLATGDHRRAMRALRGSLAIEGGCAVAILALVARLGTLAPPASGM